MNVSRIVIVSTFRTSCVLCCQDENHQEVRIIKKCSKDESDEKKREKDRDSKEKVKPFARLSKRHFCTKQGSVREPTANVDYAGP
jgi:hypothetical protein